MTILRDEFVFVELKSSLTAGGNTISVLAATGSFRNPPDPDGVDEAYYILVDDPDAPTKWEIGRYDDRTLNGAGDGYDLSVLERAVDSSAGAGTGESFSAGHFLYQTYTVAEAKAFLDLKLSLSGGTMTGALDMGGNAVSNAGQVTSTRQTISDASPLTEYKETDTVDLDFKTALIGGIVFFRHDADDGSLVTHLMRFDLNTDAIQVNVPVDMNSTLDVDGAASLNSTTTATGLITANGGINFGQSDLNYYEKGTSTLTLVGKTTAGSHAYSDQTLWYSRRGDWVDFQFRITATIDGSWAGEVEIQGLPFPAALTGTIYFDNITRWGYGVNPGDTPTGRIFGSNIPIYVLQSGTGAGIKTADASNFGADGTVVRLWGSGGYRV